MKQDEIFEYVDAYRWASSRPVAEARKRLKEINDKIDQFTKAGMTATGRLKATRLGYKHAIDWLLTGKERKRDINL